MEGTARDQDDSISNRNRLQLLARAVPCRGTAQKPVQSHRTVIAAWMSAAAHPYSRTFIITMSRNDAEAMLGEQERRPGESRFNPLTTEDTSCNKRDATLDALPPRSVASPGSESEQRNSGTKIRNCVAALRLSALCKSFWIDGRNTFEAITSTESGISDCLPLDHLDRPPRRCLRSWDNPASHVQNPGLGHIPFSATSDTIRYLIAKGTG